MKAPLTPHSKEDEEDTKSLLDRMKRTVDEIEWRRSAGPSGHDEWEEEGAKTAGTGRVDGGESAEKDIEDDYQADEEEENSDKENGLAFPSRPPSSPELELEPDVTEISPHTPAPLSPISVALDLDLELEMTPLPQPTCSVGTSRRQHNNAFSGLQTTALPHVVKHLFPSLAPVPSTAAVRNMRTLFRGAGKGAGMGIRGETLYGVGYMPEWYRAG